MNALTCPTCGGRLDLLHGEVRHPLYWHGCHVVLPRAEEAAYDACGRCEYAETVATLLALRPAPKRPS